MSNKFTIESYAPEVRYRPRGIENSGEAAANVSSEVFAQRKGGYVDDADDGVFRHVGRRITLSPVGKD